MNNYRTNYTFFAVVFLTHKKCSIVEVTINHYFTILLFDALNITLSVIVHKIDRLKFSISRLVQTPDSDDEDNNNTYEHHNHHKAHDVNGKTTPHSEIASSCKDSCTKSRSRSSSPSR